MIKQRIIVAVVVLVASAGGAICARAAEAIPPKPTRYFNDYANVVDRRTADRLNQQLADFEKQTTNQIVVVVYPKMQSDSSIEDYTVRVAQQWHVGQKGRDNGAVLFVFTKDRKMYIQVGYGLEGALPDALAKQIIERELKPRFRNNDFAGGFTAAVNAMINATKGEYKAAPQSSTGGRPRGGGRGGGPCCGLFALLFLFILISVLRRGFGGGGYSRYGRYRRRGPGFIFVPTIGGGSWGGGGGGGWSGGGGSWGGGGGFSSGGGSFGGGGAGGSW